jgi:LmbE family N-acetylglucosaminyl deacetylase
MKRLLLGSIAVGALVVAAPGAQLRVTPVDELQGHVALGLVLRHLANTGIVMEATAHPDDEDNGLLVMLNRGQGFRTALATATRGNGGQNEIGPEIFEALGVLRTQELAALHRFDGAEQYFTRAVDFGYSFSIEETFEKWGKDEITEDYVRLIRTIRPDVIFAMNPAGDNGGQHHNASAVLSHEAFKLAGDASKFPDQLKSGLRPWQPKKFYYAAAVDPNANPAPRVTRISTSVYDSLLGKTYSDIGTEARSMHKCQGMAQLLALPGPSARTYQLAESTLAGQLQRDDRSLTDGIDTSIVSLAQFAGARPPRALTDGLGSIAAAVQNAQKKFDTDTDDATVAPLVAGLHAVRLLRGQLRAMPIDDGGKYEIEFRLRQKEREFQMALIAASGIRVEALSDDGVVVPGQAVTVSLTVANHGAAEIAVRQVILDGFASDAACTLTQVTGLGGGGRGGRGGGRGGRADAPPPPPPVVVTSLKKDVVGRCEPRLTVPASARVSEPYWHREGEAGRYTFDADAPFGLPFRPTAFYAQVTFGFPGAGKDAVEEVIHGLPVQYRYQGDIFGGEKRSDLLVVPALSVRVSPDVAIVPAASLRPAPAAAAPATPRAPAGRRGGAPVSPPPAPAPVVTPTREVRVTVVNGSPAAVEGVVTLDMPKGWTATPAEQPLTLSRQDESQTVRFAVTPAPAAAAGEYRVRAVVTSGGKTFDRGYQVVEYPHIRRQHIFDAANVLLKVIDVKTAPNLLVGYIMGVGDQVPSAIEQLGARVEFVNAEDLAWGNLARFDTIVTGVRAYERRGDLRANNSRLLEYVRNGGNLVVQYNKFEFNDAQYGPYTAKVSNDRVTDERAPVTVLAAADPILNTPNRIADASWNGWVQERGLYFLDADHDSRYQDLLQIEDPFPSNKGAKRGALVEAAYGKGRWVYLGLGLWRELPAGVDGAYQLLANLISLGKPTAAATPVPAPPRTPAPARTPAAAPSRGPGQ